MNTQEIIEGNKLIAEFMGWQKSIFENLPNKMYKENYTIGKAVDQFSYHIDWNELMSVVEKIHLKREVKEVSIHPRQTRIWLQESFIQSPCVPENNSITECWIVCVAFIKLHNKNK